MNRKKIVWLLLICSIGLPVYSQVSLTKPDSEAKNKSDEDNPNKIPNSLIISKALSVQIVDFVNDDSKLTVKMKNTGQEKIVSMRIRFGNGSYMLPLFSIEPDKEREYSAYIGYGVEQGFIVEAVLFKDGEGEGEQDKLDGLKMVFIGSKNELQKIAAIIDDLSDESYENGKVLMDEFEKKLVGLPDEYVDFKKAGMGGAMLFSGKFNFLNRVGELKKNKRHTEINWILVELGKFKKEIENTIATYPNVKISN